MPSTYELWLCDDAGRRIALLRHTAYFSYSRSLLGYGTLQVGLPYDELAKEVFPVFETDRRIDVWRSPDTGHPLRRECTYILRAHKIYTRETDDMKMISFSGLDPTHLLQRRFVIQAAGTEYTYKDGPIDDLMKAIVREQMLWDSARNEDGVLDNDRAYPLGEFAVEANSSMGPSMALAFAEHNVRDVLNDLKKASFQLNQADLSSRRIYYDIVSHDLSPVGLYILDEDGNPILAENGEPLYDETSYSGYGIAFQFKTFADLRGQDRTQGVVFSVENNNLEAPYYSQDTTGEVNAVIVKGYGRGDSRVSVWDTVPDRVKASRWNRMEAFEDGSQEPDQNRLASMGYARLYDGAPKENLSTVFLNVPGGPDTPRSLYGLDWDLGDLVPVDYAGRQFNAEIVIVYVGVDENGVETITGRNEVAASAG